jgi:PAS domain-containing protein
MRPPILKLALNTGLALLLAAIVLAGATIGSLILHASVRDTLYQTAIITLALALIGTALAFVARRSPLRRLDRTLEALRKTQRDLAEQNTRLDAALMNMSQGLCMYDADGRLAIFNSRFAEIYGLPKDKVFPGMTTYDLMALLRGSGNATDVDPQGTLAIRDSIYREGKGGAFVQHLTDGRSISILYRPRPGGGFVVTFEDITERLAAEERIKHLAMMPLRSCPTAPRFTTA